MTVGSIADKTPGTDHKGVREPEEQADQRDGMAALRVAVSLLT